MSERPPLDPLTKAHDDGWMEGYKQGKAASRADALDVVEERVRVLRATYEHSRDEATLASIPSAASDFASAVEACTAVLAILAERKP